MAEGDIETIQSLNRIGVTMEITGDVMTLKFQKGPSEDWLAVSPAMLDRDGWHHYEAIEFAGRTWIKCEGGIS